MSETHQLDIRVYYEDTDAGGIVYYANYLKFFERARTEWLRTLGVEQDVLLAQDLAFVVRKVLMDNKAPGRFNQLLTVRSEIRQLKKASLVFWQEIYNENADLLCSAEVSIACVKLSLMKASAIPRDILEVLSGGNGRTFGS
ncbi:MULTISPECIES: tol-pal system-associated acyl-CoA thioesterase [Rheinheimera]|uniref:Tol-pal system-associated acyl-CoA thioesterase n=1 Tax=Rheinheimera marina TaxID=1774958 RepID=A0ABV9JKI1_9GAMM